MRRALTRHDNPQRDPGKIIKPILTDKISEILDTSILDYCNGLAEYPAHLGSIVFLAAERGQSIPRPHRSLKIPLK